MPKRGMRRKNLLAGGCCPIAPAEIMATYRAYRAAQPLRYPELEATAIAAIKRRAAEREIKARALLGAKTVATKKRASPKQPREIPLTSGETGLLARIKRREEKTLKKRRGREGGKGRLGKN
jgi:hypothetical protein